jgi:hypothetical protein
MYRFFFKIYKTRVRETSPMGSVFVNDVDVISQEKITEIPVLRVYRIDERKRCNSLSSCDSSIEAATDHHSYAFDLKSLYRMLPSSLYFMNFSETIDAKRKLTTVVNPWSQRMLMPEQVITAFSLFKLLKLICPDYFEDEIENHFSYFGDEIYPICSTTDLNFSRSYIHKMKGVRQFSLNQRITNLFCEINYLQNYIDRSWFDEMDRSELFHFYKDCYYGWKQISAAEKKKIYTFKDPFRGAFDKVNNYSSINMIKEACVVFMENIVFTEASLVNKQTGIFFIIRFLVQYSESAQMSSYGDLFN